MIKRVKIENYRSIAQAEVELGPLCVLVGRNGAGKSTFVDVLRLVRDALRFNLETAVDFRGGIASLSRWTPTGRSQSIHIEYDAEWNDNDYVGMHSFILARTPTTGYRVKHETARVDYSEEVIINAGTSDEDYFPNEGSDRMEVQDGMWKVGPPNTEFTERDVVTVDPLALQLAAQTGFNNGLSELRRQLLRTSFYTIFPNTLRQPQKPSSEIILNEHGENLGSALKQILTQGKWKYDVIAAMRRLVGDVTDIRVKSAGGYLVTEIKHESEGKRDKWFDLSQESDGTLRMLGLLVAVYQDPPPTLIVIEEPELTIHPGALAILADILREASLRTQVLLTTQSPDLVSYFAASEIRVVERSNGVTEIGLMDEMQRHAIEQHLFTGGELLKLEGLRRNTTDGDMAVA